MAMATDAAGTLSNAQFFDNLVSLVPPRFYKGHEGEAFNIKYMKRDDRAAAKLLMKEQRKVNKRARLDPDAKPTARPANADLEGLVDDSEDEEDSDDDDEAGPSGSDDDDDEEGGGGGGANQNGKRGRQSSRGGGAAAAAGPPGMSLADANASGTLSFPGSVSREELRKRLQVKLEAIRAQRNVTSKGKVAAAAKEWRDKALADTGRPQDAKKGKGQQQQQQQAKALAAAAAAKKGPGSADKQAAKKSPQQQQQAAAAAAAPPQQPGQARQNGKAAAAPAAAAAAEAPTEEFKFGLVEVDDAVVGTHADKQKRKAPTAVLLKQAEARAKDALDSPADEATKSQEAWGAALKRARGEKVLDDPKLLRRTLKKEAKASKKSEKEWKKRGDSVKGQQSKTQAKRTGNLDARVTAKFDAKKARREKKLLGGQGRGGGGGAAAGGAARAGFEGRKAGFIGSKPAAAAKA